MRIIIYRWRWQIHLQRLKQVLLILTVAYVHLGAGAGNTQTEVMVAVLEKLGYKTDIDLYEIIDVANELIAPMMQHPQEITGSGLNVRLCRCVF